MTPEEKAVLEAVKLMDPLALREYRMGSRLAEAAAAYRKSLEPKPRYQVQPARVYGATTYDEYIVQGPLKEGWGDIARCNDSWSAERIAKLLNESEYNHLPGR